ncbi:MAG: hypothetical protein R6V27_15115 [Balneolaceae bacterium]
MYGWNRGAIEVGGIDIQEHSAANISTLEWIVNLAMHLASENSVQSANRNPGI